MTAERKPDGNGRPPREEPQRSGEGAQTALQALIRKRKEGENAQAPEAEPPQPPAA